MGANYTSANYTGANYTSANYTGANYASANLEYNPIIVQFVKIECFAKYFFLLLKWSFTYKQHA